MTKLKSVLLNTETYRLFLTGNEIRLANTKRDLKTGEQLLILKDTIANHTMVDPPKRENQSDYIGIEGIVVKVTENAKGLHDVFIKKI